MQLTHLPLAWDVSGGAAHSPLVCLFVCDAPTQERVLSAVFSLEARGPCVQCGLPIAPDRVALVRDCDTCDALLCCSECQRLHEETCVEVEVEEEGVGNGDASGQGQPGLSLEVEAARDGTVVGGGFSVSPTTAAAAAAGTTKVRSGEGGGLVRVSLKVTPATVNRARCDGSCSKTVGAAGGAGWLFAFSGAPSRG